MSTNVNHFTDHVIRVTNQFAVTAPDPEVGTSSTSAFQPLTVFLSQTAGGTFAGPPGEFATITQNMDGSFTRRRASDDERAQPKVEGALSQITNLLVAC